MIDDDDESESVVDGIPTTPTTCSASGSSGLFHHINWKALLLGQLLSLVLAGTGAVQATLHLNCNLSAPTFNLGVTYLFLSFHLILLYRRQQEQQRRQKQGRGGEILLVVQKQQRRRRNDNNGTSIAVEVTTAEDDTVDDNDAEDDDVDVVVTDDHMILINDDNDDDDGMEEVIVDQEAATITTTTTTPAVSSTTTVKRRLQQGCDNDDDDDGSSYGDYYDAGSSLDGQSKYYYPFFNGTLYLRQPYYIYFFMALLDVEANYVTILAYRYTTLTSITLFDALAIPAAMIISRIFLRRKYSWVHLLGVISCMVGVILNVLQDYESEYNYDNTTSTGSSSRNSTSSIRTEDELYPHKLRGDILAIIGGILYGLNDVLTEVCVQRNGSTTEYMGMVGFFAFLISLIQAMLLERNDIMEFVNGRGGSSSNEEDYDEGNIDSSSSCPIWMGWWLYVTFVALNVGAYAGASQFLILSEAAFFNLSLLTGDLWSVLFSVVAEHIIPQHLFFLALLFVVSGVIIYEMAPSPIDKDNNSSSKEIHSSIIISQQDPQEHYHDELDSGVDTRYSYSDEAGK